jgi:predicted branched-subunit amino acid permease
VFFLRSTHSHPEFWIGARDLLPAAPGIAAWGLVTGVAMAKSGLSTLEALLMAVVVFSGSSQLAALPLIVAGAPLGVIWATGFCVNLRFAVFSAHLRPYLSQHPRWLRIGAGYFIADLTYVTFIQRFPVPASDQQGQQAQDAYLAGNCLLNWLSWVVPGVLGVLLGDAVPAAWGLGFAGILALLGMTCSMASSKLRRLSALVAGAAAVAAYALPLKLNILAAIAAAVAACLLAEALKRPPGGKAARP